jgi:hypothetical protein
MKKKRLPITQLKEAGEIARKMLVERKIIAEDSILDKLRNDKSMPVLPGIPEYLPHQWTIKASQQMMYDLLLMWKDKCKNPKKVENITEFFKFLVNEMQVQIKKFQKEEKAMAKRIKSIDEVPVLREIFSPIQKKETAKAIQRFFVDSFAVAVMLKNQSSTSEYAVWFLEWTQDMDKLWSKREKEKTHDVH